jgi:FKBP-type peptidyl-prolyl cis-trans isomerase FkpA
MNNRIAIGAVALVAIAVIAGVVMTRKTPETAPEATAPASQSAPAEVTPEASAPPEAAAPKEATSMQTEYLAENLKKPGWKATDSGLQYFVEKSVESGPKPASGSVVTVNYEGKFIDGNVFDSSYARKEPATFPLDRVIQGWQEGVPMMKVGEIWQFAIPADLAYGDGGGPIPAGATLLFKVELLEAKTPAQ